LRRLKKLKRWKATYPGFPLERGKTPLAFLPLNERRLTTACERRKSSRWRTRRLKKVGESGALPPQPAESGISLGPLDHLTTGEGPAWSHPLGERESSGFSAGKEPASRY